jgi:hypothetical protein
MWPIEFGREESRGGFQDFIRPAQLGDLTLEPLDIGVLLAGQPRPVPVVDLRPAHRLAQRLRGADPQLLCDRADRGPLRWVVGVTSATMRTARSRNSGGYRLARTTTPSKPGYLRASDMPGRFTFRVRVMLDSYFS